MSGKYRQKKEITYYSCLIYMYGHWLGQGLEDYVLHALAVSLAAAMGSGHKQTKDAEPRRSEIVQT